MCFAAAGLTVPLVLAGTALADNPHDAPPGQERAAERSPAPQASGEDRGKSEQAPRGRALGQEKSAERAKPAKPAKPAKKSKPAKKARPAKPAKPATPRRPAKAPGQAKAKEHGPAAKTTICHSTGSATNPYVTITISDNALPAHRRHHDGRDIVPAPAGGCPGTEAAADAPKPPKGKAKVTICHATGSDTNPYVRITIAEPAVAAHRRHQDGRDIIPAPEGDCPATAAPAAAAAPGAPSGASTPPGRSGLTTVVETLAPAAAVVAPLVAGAVGVTPAEVPAAAVLGELADGGTTASRPDTAAADTLPDAGVLGEQAAGTVRREAGADAPAAAASSGSLPFTGLDLVLVAAAGIAALLGGLALRRSMGRSAA